MPRGVPNKKRRGRHAAAEEETPAEENPEGTEDGQNGYAPPTLGEAIENVRASLEPFDVSTRKKIMRAVTAVLK